MKSIWQKIGIALFWLVWPVLGLYLRRTTRTRLLIVCGSEILVTKTWLGDGRWSLPGGGLHRGEDPAAGVLRETREEIGISLQPGVVRLISEQPYRGRGLEFNCYYFVAELAEKPSLKLHPLEMSGSRWVTLGDIHPGGYGPDVIAAIQAYRAS